MPAIVVAIGCRRIGNSRKTAEKTAGISVPPAKPCSKRKLTSVAKLPLNAQPGSEWHYSISTDIQGYIVQKLSGMPFEEFLDKRIVKPLGMVDTGFYVPPEKLKRFAEFYDYDKDGGLHVLRGGLNHDFSVKPALPSGGGGLVSTATDYMRFCQMLLNGGELDGVRLLSPLTVELMRTNVLPPTMPIFVPGAGFGLDFAVYTDPAAAGGYYGKDTFGGAAPPAPGFGSTPRAT